LSFLIDHILDGDAAARRTKGEQEAEQARRISRILEGQTEKGRRFVLDPSPYVSVRCPRRSGKSFAMASKAVYVGECKPNSRILVISLTLKSTKENYWAGAPSGIFRMDQMFDLGLRRHDTDLIWWHQNGSRGRLAGAETRSDIEYLRGAAAEADIVLLDECKSFAPQLLEELIRDVLEPGMMTRNGQIVMGGTPGLIPFGPFYDATSLDAHREDGTPTCALFGTRESVQVPVDVTSEEEAPDEPWSLHTWTVRDNTAAPGQWSRALRIKRRAGWDDTNPTWRREFLGDWVTDAQGLVYGFAGLRNDGDRVIWNPQRCADNPTGLPHEDGPWRLVLGIDFGYEDDFALVLAGYSEQLCELRHVYDFKSPHLVVDQMVEAICDVVDRFGAPDAMVGDAGGLGKALVETLNQTYALPVVKAEKHEKFDYIELLNSDFHAGGSRLSRGPTWTTSCAVSNGTSARVARSNWSGRASFAKTVPAPTTFATHCSISGATATTTSRGRTTTAQPGAPLSGTGCARSRLRCRRPTARSTGSPIQTASATTVAGCLPEKQRRPARGWTDFRPIATN
jgi:hypothetical protein